MNAKYNIIKHKSPILIAPGYGGSDENHWQTLWQRDFPAFIRIEQKNWDAPIAIDWINSFEKIINKQGENTIIVAHSLACITLALWAQQTKLKIKGALLIAPADSENPDFKLNTIGFSNIPKIKLPFESIVVASNNDPFCHIEKAKLLAEKWGSDFINVGAKGHINSDSKIEHWHEGLIFLDNLLTKTNQLENQELIIIGD